MNPSISLIHKKGLYATRSSWHIDPFLFYHIKRCILFSPISLFFLSYFPVKQSLAFFVKFYPEAYHLSSVCLERLQIVIVDNLANGGFLASIVPQFQLYNIDIARSGCYHIYPASGKHAFYLYLQTNGIEKSACFTSSLGNPRT